MNNLTINYNNIDYCIDVSSPLEISIPYNFNGNQPNFYNVPPGTKEPLKFGESIFDNKNGCNVPIFKFNIHCTGTHTETIGHILDEKNFYINKILPLNFLSSVLITINPVCHSKTIESYHVETTNDDLVITSSQVKDAISKFDINLIEALIIRTTPNDSSKMYRKYVGNVHPFFTNEAMRLISSLNISHIIIDTPSVDRADDGGVLLNHKIFWCIDKDNNSPKSLRTITEFAFIDNSIQDDHYFIQFLLPNFNNHVSPSRPILYRCNNV